MAVMKFKLPDGTWVEVPALVATVTAEKIKNALGYTPADAASA